MQQYFKIGALTTVILGIVASFGVMSTAFSPRTDKLPDSAWWKTKVQYQVNATRDRQLSGCLFGDSISSGLGNTLGRSTFNFAMGGMSSVSLLAQLKQLKAANVQCQKVVIAIGTNDAMYNISDNAFRDNLEQIIDLAQSLGASYVTVLPAFYSTIPASQDPKMAGTLDRVDEISDLIRQVAFEKRVAIVNDELQPFWRDRSLKEELTMDGVHLNEEGRKIYRQLIRRLFSQTVGSR